MIHERTSLQKLAALRIILFVTIALYALIVPAERLAALPPGVHHPLGLAAYLPRTFLTFGVLLGLRCAAAALLLAAAAGARRYRLLATAGLLAFTLFLALIHAGHRELGALYLGYALAFGPAAAVGSLRATGTEPRSILDARSALTLQVATFVFLLTYGMIGAQRLLSGAPLVFRDGSMLWHVANNSGRNGSFGWTFGYTLLERVPLIRSLIQHGFLVGTCFEALAPLALFFRPFRRAFVVFALGFHAINLLLLNIDFSLNMLVVVLLLIDYDPWLVRGKRREVNPPTPWAAASRME